MKCEDCEFWDKSSKGFQEHHLGVCQNEKGLGLSKAEEFCGEFKAKEATT